MSKPRVVHVRVEPFDVYIGRTFKEFTDAGFGNPFHLGSGGRQGAISNYRAWLLAPEQAELLRRVKVELRGKVLGCWCSPKACHGDVLLEIANSEEQAKS